MTQIPGIELKKFLKTLKITQEEASYTLKVSRQTINNWCKMAFLDNDIVENVKTKYPDFAKYISLQAKSIINEPKTSYQTSNLSNDVDLREIFEMMKKLVDSNAKLSEGIENVTQSNKILAQNSNKIADSIHQITESNAELTHTNQLLAQSNAELISKYAGRGMDAKDVKVADVG